MDPKCACSFWLRDSLGLLNHLVHFFSLSVAGSLFAPDPRAEAVGNSCRGPAVGTGVLPRGCDCKGWPNVPDSDACAPSRDSSRDWTRRIDGVPCEDDVPSDGTLLFD